eukprot:2570914-Prymnesium_polylepis.1
MAQRSALRQAGPPPLQSRPPRPVSPRRAHAHQRCGPERCSPHQSMCAHHPVPSTTHAHMLLLRAHRPDEPARLEAPE